MKQSKLFILIISIIISALSWLWNHFKDSSKNAPSSTISSPQIQGDSLVLSIKVIPETHLQDYNRKEWHHWSDLDHNCINTRNEVLKAESKGAISTSKDGCKITQGKWICPYTGKQFSSPKLIDIDHWVALREAHVSGGWQWDEAQKEAFANDLEDPNHLVAVDRESNREKGDKDPAEWLPPNDDFKCPYVVQWIKIKKRWNLSMDSREFKKIQSIMDECKSQNQVYTQIRAQN